MELTNCSDRMYDTQAPKALPRALSDCLTVLVCRFSERIIFLSNDGAKAILKKRTIIPAKIMPRIAKTVISFIPTDSAA